MGNALVDSYLFRELHFVEEIFLNVYMIVIIVMIDLVMNENSSGHCLYLVLSVERKIILCGRKINEEMTNTA